MTVCISPSHEIVSGGKCFRFREGAPRLSEKDARQAFGKSSNVIPSPLPATCVAKQWIRNHARGTERYGLVASSKAQRLKPDAIDIRVEVDPVHWFLNEKEDTRSSYYLEDAATEFQVQGLELDWACVAWDGDFRFTDSDGAITIFAAIVGAIANPENRLICVTLTACC